MFRNISFCCYSEQWFSILTISGTVSQCWELACDFFSSVQTGKCAELRAFLCSLIKRSQCLMQVPRLCLTSLLNPSAHVFFFLTFSGIFQPLQKAHYRKLVLDSQEHDKWFGAGLSQDQTSEPVWCLLTSSTEPRFWKYLLEQSLL